jgi:hypothetical protein
MIDQIVSPTQMVLTLLQEEVFNKITMSEELDVSRPTLNSRIEGRTQWKKLERKWIHHLYRKHITNKY